MQRTSSNKLDPLDLHNVSNVDSEKAIAFVAANLETERARREIVTAS